MRNKWGLSALGPSPSKVYIKDIINAGSAALKVRRASSSPLIVKRMWDRESRHWAIVNIHVFDRFTVMSDNFVAQIGPDVAWAQNRKNCQLNINLQYPQGFQ